MNTSILISNINEPDLTSRVNKLATTFTDIFGSKHETIVRSPGRAEIIGNHTDYNEGYALSACISRSILALSKKRKDKQINVVSTMFQNQKVSFEISDNIPKDTKNTWTNFIRGVIQTLMKNGYEFDGADILFDSTIPSTGVSSSAALELATAFSLLAEQEIDRKKIALMCKLAENEYVESPCGFLDQGTIAFGAKDKMVLFDFMPQTDSPVSKIELINADFSSSNASFVVISDKTVKRELGSSGYPARRKMCEDSLSFWEQKLGRHIPSLRYVTAEDFESYRDELEAFNTTMRKRVEHVIYENQRVLKFIELLKNKEIKYAGKLLTEAGKSALELYELDEKTPELTFLFNTGKEIDGVLGFRNMGGGFNATTLALVDNDYSGTFQTELYNRYTSEFDGELNFVKFEITDGVNFIS